MFAATMRDLGLSSTETVFLRLVFASTIGLAALSTFSVRRSRRRVLLDSFRAQRGYFLQGILLTLAIYSYVASLSLHTPIGEAAFLVQIHPIITLLIGRMFLKETITKAKRIAVVLAIVGLFILAEPWRWESFLSSVVGDTFALLNGLFYALYIILGRAEVRNREKIGEVVSMGWVLFWSFLTGIFLFVSLSIFPPITGLNTFDLSKVISSELLLLGLGLALVGSIVPYFMIMIATKYIESSKASILLLGEAISAAILGYIFLQEPITIFYFMGGGLLLIAIIIITLVSMPPTTQKSGQNTSEE